MLRLLTARQSLYADEASTYWVTQRSFGGMLEIITDKMELTPPLSFAVTWLATRFGDGVFLMRAAPLLFGLLAIPAVYALGVRTVGRNAGLVGAALIAFSPFTVFVSALSRAYSLVVLLSAVAALCALVALDTGRRRWWVAFGLAAAAGMYTHYTAIFALAALYAWLLIAEPRARVPATLAGAGAALLFVPWALTGLANDFGSPDTRLAALLVDFSPKGVVQDLGHWAIGHTNGSSILHDLPGPVGLVLIALGLAAAASGLRPGRPPSRLALVIALAVAAPLGALLESLLADPSFTTNVLASSTPGLALLAGALTQAAAPRLRPVAAGLLVAGIAVGGIKTATPAYAGPDIGPSRDLIERQAGPDDVVIDASGAAFGTPGPLTPLDLVLDERVRIVRFGVPEDRENQFRDQPAATPQEAVARAVREAGPDGRIFVAFVESAAFGATSDPVPFLRQLGLSEDFALVSQTTVASTFGRSDALLFSR